MYDIDRGHRPQFRAYGGDRPIEIVSGKVYSANHPTLATRSSRYRWGSPPPSASSLPPITKPKGGSGWFGWEWGALSDPEMKRRTRVASYKAYAVEGKVKASLRKGARWIKIKCSQIIRGF